MESTSAGPKGPNLQAGVPLDSLEEGRPLAGHVGDDAVLLTRYGAEVVAIGATCTHYSGPLGEGLTTDGVVRCPWHHACFSLRTGEAVGPPALNPLPRYRTIIEAGRVRVGELLPAATSSRTPAARPRAIAIIGAGAAGAMAAETLRTEGYDGPITLIDPDAAAPYDRPNLSKDFLAGIAPEEWLPLRTSDFYAQHEIERVVASAQSIDAARRAVLLSDGRAVEFDVALLATGATPVRPPIPGNDGAHVHVLRSLADCRRLIDAARPGTRAVIAGASFIGMEAAAALRAREVDVTVVAPEATPFARTLGEELGGLLRARHEQNGVSFRLGRTLAQIGAQTVKLDDGTSVPADFVLLGVGVRPALDLARSAGLALDNGVLVDEYLESSVRGIYVAGDSARYPDPVSGERIRIEHWVAAQRQGQSAARNMLGARARFSSVPFFWTHQYDVTIAYTGHAASWDAVRIDGAVSDLDCAVSYLRGELVLAVATINRDQASLRAEVALERSIR